MISALDSGLSGSGWSPTSCCVLKEDTFKLSQHQPRCKYKSVLVTEFNARGNPVMD